MINVYLYKVIVKNETELKEVRELLDTVRERQNVFDVEQAQVSSALNNLGAKCLDDLGKPIEDLPASLTAEERKADVSGASDTLDMMKKKLETSIIYSKTM